jgi:hypothetical protein
MIVTYVALFAVILVGIVAWNMIFSKSGRGGGIQDASPSGRSASDKPVTQMSDEELRRRINSGADWKTSYFKLPVAVMAEKDAEFKANAAFLSELQAELARRHPPPDRQQRAAAEALSIIESALRFPGTQEDIAIQVSLKRWADFDLPNNVERDGYRRKDVLERFFELRDAGVNGREAVMAAFMEKTRS